jgi:hypothetical protein
MEKYGMDKSQEWWGVRQVPLANNKREGNDLLSYRNSTRHHNSEDLDLRRKKCEG